MKPLNRNPGRMGIRLFPSSPMELVSIDFLADLPITHRGNRHILSINDQFLNLLNCTLSQIAQRQHLLNVYLIIFWSSPLPKSYIQTVIQRSSRNYSNCKWKCSVWKSSGLQVTILQLMKKGINLFRIILLRMWITLIKNGICGAGNLRMRTTAVYIRPQASLLRS